MHFTTSTPGPGRHVLPRRTWLDLRDPAGLDVPLNGLLDHARPAYGAARRCSWNQAVNSLLAWPSEAFIVEAIAAEIEAGVALEEPVWVHARRGQRVRNGMHRIAAHILVGAPTIRATTAQRIDTEHDEMIYVNGVLTPLPGVPQVRGVPDDEDDFGYGGWDHLRSLRAGPVWATSDFMAMCSEVGEVAYYAQHRHKDAVLAAMTQRAAQTGYALEVRQVRLRYLGQDFDDIDDALRLATAASV